MPKAHFDLTELSAHVADIHNLELEEARAIIQTALAKTAEVVAEVGYLHYDDFGSLAAKKRAGRTYNGFRKPVSKGDRIALLYNPAETVKRLVKDSTGLECIS